MPLPGNFDQQVPGKREDLHVPVGRVELDEHDHVAAGAGRLAEVLEAVEACAGVGADHQKYQRLGRLGGPDRQFRHHVFELVGVVAEGVLSRSQRPIDPEDGDIGHDEEDDESAA